MNLPSYFLQIKKGAPQSNGERTQKSTSSYCCETNLQKIISLHHIVKKTHILPLELDFFDKVLYDKIYFWK